MRPSPKNMCSVRHEPDAARAERVRRLRLVGLIGVGADAQAAELVGPRQQLLEALVDRRDSLAFISPATTCRISLGFVATWPIFTSPVRPSNDT